MREPEGASAEREAPKRGGGSTARDALAIGAATGVFGVSFGVLAVAAGLSVGMTCASSLLVFTGASQFAAVGVIGAGGSPVAAVAGGLLLAARNTAYGLALAPLVRGGPLRRLLGAQLVIDESTAMATAREDPDDARRAFWLTGLAVFTLWNLGTLIGALAGGALGDPEALGLDAAFPAAFLALLAPQLRRAGAGAAALAGALLAVALVPFAPPGLPILAAALGVIPGVVLAAKRRRAEH